MRRRVLSDLTRSLLRLHPRITVHIGLAVVLALLASVIAVGVAVWPYSTVAACDIDAEVARWERASVPLTAGGRTMPGFGRYVPLRRLPVHVAQAFIAVEDRRMMEWYHLGVDPVGVLAALRDNVTTNRRRPRGASTIAMQLARSLCGNRMPPDHTWRGKKAEAILALHVTRQYGRRRVLELYLNTVFLGRNQYGVDAAAQSYFGKRAETLSPSDAAELAHLVASPFRRDPRSAGAAVRRRAIASVFVRIATLDARYASTVPRRIAPSPLATTPGPAASAPLVRRVLAPLGPCGKAVRCPATVLTFIDEALQASGQRSVDQLVARLERERRARARNRAIRGRVEGVYVAMDARSGHVRAYVAHRGDNPGGADILLVGRIQPASTLKPLLFASAVDAIGIRPTTTIGDFLQRACTSAETRSYVQRLSGGRARRKTLRDAMVSSDNVLGPCLLDGLPGGSRQRLSDAGLLRDPAAPAVDGMGIQGVSPFDLLASYAALFNDGLRPWPRISAEEPRRAAARLFSRDAARATAQILRDVARRGTAYRAGQLLPRGELAGKTGTAQHNHEMLFVGVRDDLVSLLWVGVVDGPGAVAQGTAGDVVVRPWARVMEEWEASRRGG